MFDNIVSFLQKQKEEMMRLDESEGLHKREDSGRDFAVTDKVTGKRKGLREILYDNTIAWILSESNGLLFPEFFRLSQPGVLNEDTLTTGIATFTTSLLPGVRRIYSRLMALELVSVQPLGGPTGIIYWMDHKFGSNYSGSGESVTAGDRLDQTRVKGYAGSSEQGTIRDINFALSSKTITAGTKKLKATWSLEAQQDLNSQWKLDLWAELMPQLVDEIAREIDLEISQALLAGAGAGNVNWNANGYLTDDKSTIEKRAYRETLYEAIEDAANYVFKKKYIRPNWLLMNSDVFTRLAKLEKFNADPSITPDQQAMIGWRYEGTLAGKYRIFVDPAFTANKILLGYRGADWKYAVGYYAPYIPVFLSEEYIVSDDFTQRARGAMTRYKAGVIPETNTGSTNNGLATVTVTLS